MRQVLGLFQWINQNGSASLCGFRKSLIFLGNIEERRFKIPNEYNMSKLFNDEFIQRIYSSLPISIIYQKEKLNKEKSYQNMKNASENSKSYKLDNKCEFVLCKKYQEGEWNDSLIININLSGNILDNFSYNLAVRSNSLNSVLNSLKSLGGKKKSLSVPKYVDFEIGNSNSKSLNFGRIYYAHVSTKADEAHFSENQLKKFKECCREDICWKEIIENGTESKSLGVFLISEAETGSQVKLIVDLLKNRPKESLLEKVHVYCNSYKERKDKDQYEEAVIAMSEVKIEEKLLESKQSTENMYIIRGLERNINECNAEIQKEMNRDVVDEVINIRIEDRDVAGELLKMISENVIFHKVLEGGTKVLVKDNRKELNKLKAKIFLMECRTLTKIPEIVYPDYFSNFEQATKHGFFFHRVTAESKDFNTIESSFNRGLAKSAKVTLKNIFKIENYFLYNMFQLQRETLKEDLAGQEIVVLFRGPGKYNDIVNFNASRLELNSSIWGSSDQEELTFYETSEVAIKESFFNKNKNMFQIFLAEVIVSAKNTSSGQLFTIYDTAEKAFRIKNGFRAYPKYLIEFLRFD